MPREYVDRSDMSSSSRRATSSGTSKKKVKQVLVSAHCCLFTVNVSQKARHEAKNYLGPITHATRFVHVRDTVTQAGCIFFCVSAVVCLLQDDNFIYDCKAAYHVVFDDVSDEITSRDLLAEGTRGTKI